MNIKQIKNTTKEYRDLEDLRQLPLSIRKDKENKGKFDTYYNNRPVDSFLQRFTKVKLPIGDRVFGSPQEDICNIYMNLTSDKRTQDLIDDLLFSRSWIYHPVREFEKWHNIANYYYNDSSLFWTLLLFNRINNPFTSLNNFSMIRIPSISFVDNLKHRWDFL